MKERGSFSKTEVILSEDNYFSRMGIGSQTEILTKDKNMNQLVSHYVSNANPTAIHAQNYLEDMIKKIDELYPQEVDVLVVDDVIFNIMGLTKLLSQFKKFKIDSAQNGE